MRKIYLFLFFVSIVFSTVGQTRSDQATILKMCLDLPELQPYIAVDSDGKVDQITIYYWHPLLFPIDLNVTKEGKSIQYVPMSEIAGKDGNAFFLFRTFKITGNVGTVSFEYHYWDKGCSKLLLMNLEFGKTSDLWKITRASLSNEV